MILFILIYLTGSLTSYFVCRKFVRLYKEDIGEYYTSYDRIFNVIFCVFSWISVIIWTLKILDKKSETSKEEAKW